MVNHMILDVLNESWLLLTQSGPFLLGGFILAGLLHALLPVRWIASWLGGDTWGSVVRAALIGVPLPLCSCSVVPVAAALRKGGASRGATSAFLISTPESGVDSISVTYALMDPIMTVARPIAAFFTALVAGLLENLSALSGSRPAGAENRGRPAAAAQATSGCCCSGGGAPAPRTDAHCHEPARPNTPADVAEPWSRRIAAGLRFGLVDLFEDLGRYLLLGFLLAGLVAVVLRSSLPLQSALGSPWAPLIMLAAGIPMYVCASAATPLVAVLISQGLPPGAGLVFLLAGPATNAASLVVLRQILGGRGVAVYLVSIMVCALAAGYAVDGLYAWLGAAPRALTRAAHCATAPGWIDLLGAIALLALILNGVWRRYALPRLVRNGARVAESG
jgi:hypothetical protein